MSDVLTTVTTRTRKRSATPQSQPRTREQVRNKAGGYVYRADDDIRLHRFLTLGTDGGTYYTDARELTRDNAEVVFQAARTKGGQLVDKIVQISEEGRAPKNKQALFALAIAASVGDDETRAAALSALPRVARTGTHLFEFLTYAGQFRGWGKGLQKAALRWYTSKTPDQVAYQALKYRQREGWTHADVLRLAHRHGVDVSGEHAALFNWIVGRRKGRDITGTPMPADLPKLVGVFEELQSPKALPLARVADLIRANPSVSWEMIPDRYINEPKVWEALIDSGLPQTALMRQLPRLTRIGITRDSAYVRVITNQLANPERLRKARVHPINVLVALRTYALGRSDRGSSSWHPDRKIIDALDAAFYAAFGAVEPAGVRTLEALDVSGSMAASASGLPISCREASAAMAMVTAATESNVEIVGFTEGRRGNSYRVPNFLDRYSGCSMALSRLDISPRRRLDDNIKAIERLPFGGTDCALPIVWATETREEFGAFRIYTDGETWAGNIHVDEALRNYRDKTGIDARLEIIAMTANGTSLCDPKDPRQLDVSGFDSTVPQLIADHAAGRI